MGSANLRSKETCSGVPLGLSGLSICCHCSGMGFVPDLEISACHQHGPQNFPNKLREGSKGKRKSLKGTEQIEISFQETYLPFKRILNNMYRYFFLQKMDFLSPSTDHNLYLVTCFQRREKKREIQNLPMEKPTREHLTQVIMHCQGDNMCPLMWYNEKSTSLQHSSPKCLTKLKR